MPKPLFMKKSHFCLPAAALSLALLCGACSGAPEKARGTTVVSEGLCFCESTLPYEAGVLVANFGTGQLDPLNNEGKGYIAYLHDGVVETLIPADGTLSAPKGMYLRDGRLFVCDVNRMAVYDLRRPGEAPQVIAFPEGELFVNDLAADGNDLYASVTNTGRIFRLDISDLAAVGAPEPWLEVPGPNGLVIRNGAMYVAAYPADGQTTPAHVIYRVADLRQPVAEPWIKVPGQYDGIAFSSDGRTLYVTNWAPAGVSAIDLETLEMQPVELDVEPAFAGPADMSVAGGRVYIPDLPNSRVVIFTE